jgi:hypothetical protein
MAFHTFARASDMPTGDILLGVMGERGVGNIVSCSGVLFCTSSLYEDCLLCCSFLSSSVRFLWLAVCIRDCVMDELIVLCDVMYIHFMYSTLQVSLGRTQSSHTYIVLLNVHHNTNFK